MPRISNRYDYLYRSFQWEVPDRFNIASAVCDKWAAADPERPALILLDDQGGFEKELCFRDLARLANRTAHALNAHGIQRGDRIGILLPQALETALAHLGCYKLGAIAMPLFSLFGEMALEYRLADSGAKCLITDTGQLEKIAAIRDRLPALETIFVIDADDPAPTGTVAFWPTIDKASTTAIAAATKADDPALLIYTSGTTGNPKGALHAHRTLLGHLPGIVLPLDFFPKEGDRYWTPADWAWIGGLMDTLMPGLFHGVPVVAHRMAKFDPEEAVALMARHQVRNAFLPPTALKRLRTLTPERIGAAGARLRSMVSGGESLGEELLEWGRQAFGITINEIYGQTECNLVAGGCASLFPTKPGALGKAMPGHEVAIIDSSGEAVAPGEIGQIAVKRPDPVMFLGYWNNEAATREKYLGDWLLTGDMGSMDEQGYITYTGRDDDVITSAGYRIGPTGIENCLMRHPSVAMAAVIGVPDPSRTEAVKAFVILKDQTRASEALTRELQDFVRDKLAAHEYPRQIAYVDSLPMTTTGKIQRKVLREQAQAAIPEA